MIGSCKFNRRSTASFIMGPNSTRARAPVMSYKDILAKPRPPDPTIDLEDFPLPSKRVESKNSFENQEKIVEDQKYVENHLRVMYMIPAPTTIHMIIEIHINFLKALKQAAPEMIIVSNNSNIKPHSSISCLPRTERAFKMQFSVISEDRRNSTRVSVCHTVRTNDTIENIKLQTSNGFQHYLDANNITARRDQFKGEAIDAIGFLILVHPDLANRDSLHDQIRGALVNQSSNFHVPEFAIVPGKLNYSNSTDRITTKVTDIVCSKSDFTIMKEALVDVYGHEHMRRSCGQFIPRGHGYEPHVYKNLLLQHNNFLANTHCFTVLGLTKKASDYLVQINGSKSKKSVLLWLKSSQYITDIYPTRTTDNDGKWFVITTIKLADKAKAHIDSIMPSLFKHVPRELGYRCEGYYLPMRLKQGRSDTPPPMMSIDDYDDQNHLPQSIFITDATPELSASTASSSQVSIAGTDDVTTTEKVTAALVEYEFDSNHLDASKTEETLAAFPTDIHAENLLSEELSPYSRPEHPSSSLEIRAENEKSTEKMVSSDLTPQNSSNMEDIDMGSMSIAAIADKQNYLSTLESENEWVESNRSSIVSTTTHEVSKGNMGNLTFTSDTDASTHDFDFGLPDGVVPRSTHDFDFGLPEGVDPRSFGFIDRPGTTSNGLTKTDIAEEKFDHHPESFSMTGANLPRGFQHELEAALHNVSENCEGHLQTMIDHNLSNNAEATIMTKDKEIELLRAEFNEIVDTKLNTVCTILEERMEKMNKHLTEKIETSFSILSNSMIEQNNRFLEQIVSLSIQVNSLQMNAMQVNAIPSLVQQFQQQQQISQNQQHNHGANSNQIMANLAQQIQQQQAPSPVNNGLMQALMQQSQQQQAAAPANNVLMQALMQQQSQQQQQAPATANNGLMQALIQQQQQQQQQLMLQQNQLRQSVTGNQNNLNTGISDMQQNLNNHQQNLNNHQQYGYVSQSSHSIQQSQQPHVFSYPQPPIPPTQFSPFPDGAASSSVSSPNMTMPLPSPPPQQQQQQPPPHHHQLNNVYTPQPLFLQEQEPYSPAF